MNIYQICFKGGFTVYVKASKLELGRVFTKSSLVLTKEDGDVEGQAYLPIDEILYVLPLAVVAVDPIISGEPSDMSQILNS